MKGNWLALPIHQLAFSRSDLALAFHAELHLFLMRLRT
jgi:hypothetical protein